MLSLKKKPTLQASRTHVKESKILDTTPRIPDSRAGFVIFCLWKSTILRGIPDSLSFIPDSKAHDSSFHEQDFLDFRLNKNQNSLTWGD